MKSILRGRRLVTLMLLLFLAGMVVLVVRIQLEASFYISQSGKPCYGMVYDREGDVLFDGINDECTARIEEQLIACAESGRDTIYLMTDSSIDYNQAINTLFYEQPYQFFKYIEDVNYRLGNLINDEDVSFLKRERHLIIEVCIKLI